MQKKRPNTKNKGSEQWATNELENYTKRREYEKNQRGEQTIGMRFLALTMALILRISRSCIRFFSSDVIQGELRARTRIVLRGGIFVNDSEKQPFPL